MISEHETPTYKRFSAIRRFEHLILLIGFFILGVTGLAQKYYQFGLSQSFMRILGGVENVRILHRASVGVLGVLTIYHLGAVGYSVFVRRDRLTMLPGLDDARAVVQALAYNLGFSRTRPLEGRYNFAEKMEYWALVWGMIVMGASGFMLWNPIAAARFLPGEIIPAAKAAHGAEAVLAVAAIIVWHFYHVHVKFFNKSMFTGELTEAEMAHEHPLELAQIKADTAERSDSAVAIAGRRRIFVPAYLLLAAFMLTGLFYFMTFEETAIETVPPIEEVEVYVPLPPTPFPTRPPADHLVGIELTWEGGLSDLFAGRCGTCHNAFAAEGGLDLSSYQAILAGGENGAGIVPGDPHSGTLFELQSQGDHVGQFSGEELALLHDWIGAGAPEN
jgi:cytochrome b subunit of formate dehydrogenase